MRFHRNCQKRQMLSEVFLIDVLLEEALMKYAPIVIPTLNRYDKLEKCLESLSLNSGASHTDVYIFGLSSFRKIS